MPSRTVENYLKAIFHLSDGQPGETIVSPGALSEMLELTAGTVTVMLKNIESSGYITYLPRKGARLTDDGIAAAVRVIRRHRLLESFLMMQLGYNWEQVHAEAEEMEHAVSELFIDKIEELLGYPAFDPHGAPIPRRDGSIESCKGVSLRDAPIGPKRLVRVLRQEPEFLKWLSSIDLFPGEELDLIERDSVAGTLTLEFKGKRKVLSSQMSSDLLVTSLVT